MRDGRIPTVRRGGRKMIDAAIADAAWAVNTDLRKPRNSVTGEAGGEPAAGTPMPGTFRFHQTRLEELKAERQELELARRRGDVVDGKAAEEHFFKLTRDARDKTLALADRLGPALVPITDARVMTDRLRQEFIKLFRQLAAAAGHPEEPEEERLVAGS